MIKKSQNVDVFLQRTQSAFMWTRVLNTPFWAVYSLLPFILYKDLHATPLQLSLIITLKPLVSIFSMYWSASINQRRDRLRSNIIWAGILSHLPFFFFPFVDNLWFFIAAFGFYMMLERGGKPAWMEVLKLNIPGASRDRVFAYGSAFGYFGDAIVSVALGSILDGYFQAWRWIFPITAFMSLLSVVFQMRIPIRLHAVLSAKACDSISFSKKLLQPWKSALELIRERSDFGRFQWGFMIGGFGLMVMQPASMSFFVDTLHLSYTEFSVALTFCKAVGFALTSPIWVKWINQIDIYRFSAWVTIVGCLFPAFLILSQWNLLWLYAAYLSYGVMQAGSTLSWNMSGPIFAKEQDSSVFSSVNILAVGLRGCIVPTLGGVLCLYFDSFEIMILGGLMFLLSTLQMISYSKQSRLSSVHVTE